MTNKKNKNLSGSYTDDGTVIIGNSPNAKTTMRNLDKPVMRDLDTVSYTDVQNAVDKLKLKREKNIAVQKETYRQLRLEHPTMAKWEPFLKVVGVIFGIAIFLFALWIIFLVNNSVDPTLNNGGVNFILSLAGRTI